MRSFTYSFSGSPRTKKPISIFFKILLIEIFFSSLRGKTATEAADDIINNHLPKLKELSRSGQIHVDNIDVFCEKGVFDLDSTRRILQGGKDIGLQINFHGDELHPMKAAEVQLPFCLSFVNTHLMENLPSLFKDRSSLLKSWSGDSLYLQCVECTG